MTQVELYQKLKTTGYPVAHIEFSSPPTVPYIAYFYASEEQRGSDFQNLIKDSSIRVELYTEYKDTLSESKVDSVLNFTQFQKTKTKLTDEKLMMIIYEFDDVSKL